MESEKAELRKTEYDGGTRGCGMGGREKMLAEEYKLPVIRQIPSGDLIYSMVTTVNESVIILYT